MARCLLQRSYGRQPPPPKQQVARSIMGVSVEMDLSPAKVCNLNNPEWSLHVLTSLPPSEALRLLRPLPTSWALPFCGPRRFVLQSSTRAYGPSRKVEGWFPGKNPSATQNNDSLLIRIGIEPPTPDSQQTKCFTAQQTNAYAYLALPSKPINQHFMHLHDGFPGYLLMFEATGRAEA